MAEGTEVGSKTGTDVGTEAATFWGVADCLASLHAPALNRMKSISAVRSPSLTVRRIVYFFILDARSRKAL